MCVCVCLCVCVCVCVCVYTHTRHTNETDKCATAHGRRDSNTCDSDTCDSDTCATAGRQAQASLARLPSLCPSASIPQPRAAAVSSLFFSSLLSLLSHRPTHTSKSTRLSLPHATLTLTTLALPLLTIFLSLLTLVLAHVACAMAEQRTASLAHAHASRVRTYKYGLRIA
jgi:hypothetical protein